MGLYSRNQISQTGDDFYEAIAYYRLSKDDGKNHESDSIANQRVLIQEYVKSHPNIKLVEEAFDDGYTGTNYNRPGFQKVMDAVNSGTVNCVIVKDLSRLGREYVETGKYLEWYFRLWVSDSLPSMMMWIAETQSPVMTFWFRLKT